MSASRGNTRRSRQQKASVAPTEAVASVAGMLGLVFADEMRDIVDPKNTKTISTTLNPTITLRGTKAIVDFSHFSNKEDIEKIDYLFKNVLSPDDMVTLSDATYLQPGEQDEKDISGNYSLIKYDPTSKIAILNQVSVNNKSSEYERYDYKFFTNTQSVTFKTEAIQVETEECFIIQNLLGPESENSFLLGFREMRVGDILSIQGIQEDFVVREYHINDRGHEEIRVDRSVSGLPDLFGTPTLVILKRRTDEHDNALKLFYPPEETDESEDEESNNEPTRELPINTPPGQTVTRENRNNENRLVRPIAAIPTLRNTPTTTTNRRQDRKVLEIEEKKEEWLSGSRETIKVKTAKLNGKNVYYIKGKITNHEWVNYFVENKSNKLIPGETYRFDLTDRSMKGHPLHFSYTPDGSSNKSSSSSIVINSVNTNKAPGRSSSFAYLTVLNREGPIYLYCGNHKGMGFGIPVDFVQGKRSKYVDGSGNDPGIGPDGRELTGTCCYEVDCDSWLDPGHGAKKPCSICTEGKTRSQCERLAEAASGESEGWSWSSPGRACSTCPCNRSNFGSPTNPITPTQVDHDCFQNNRGGGISNRSDVVQPNDPRSPSLTPLEDLRTCCFSAECDENVPNGTACWYCEDRTTHKKCENLGDDSNGTGEWIWGGSDRCEECPCSGIDSDHRNYQILSGCSIPTESDQPSIFRDNKPDGTIETFLPNYFFPEGQEPNWVDCNIKAGICAKAGYYGGNCLYQCTSVPKSCSEL